jgi:hypothetical protein
MYYQLALGPFLSFLNFNSLPITQDIPALLERLLVPLTVVLIGMILITIGIGYAVFTGWKDRKNIPWPLRPLAAFILGLATFFIAGLLAPFIKLPLVPILIAGVSLWILLRFISSHIGSDVKYATLEQAVQAVKSLHARITGSEGVVDEVEFQPSEGTWFIRVGDMKYWVDASSGGVVRWRRTSQE